VFPLREYPLIALLFRDWAYRQLIAQTEAVYRRYAITNSAMLQEAAVKLAAFHVADSSSPS
jgi:hypothetical protein